MVNSLGKPRRRIGAIQVAEAMHYLHSKAPPLVHRDLKCANILIDESCTPLQPAAHPSRHPSLEAATPCHSRACLPAGRESVWADVGARRCTAVSPAERVSEAKHTVPEPL